jgi:hypothetical protein
MDDTNFPFAKMTKIFGKIIDLSKPSNHKKLVFAYWSISKTFAVPQTIHGEFYDAYEFSCTFEEIAESLGVSLKVAKGLIKFFNNIGWLIKSPNQVKNRANRFKWDEEKFYHEKIVSIQESNQTNEEKRADQNLEKNPVHNSQKGPTDLGVKTPKKGPTKNDVNNSFENEENGRPTQKRADQRADRFRSENTQKRADQGHASLRTKETLCLKETNINKENVAIPIVDQDLSLFHEKKDLFNASPVNEFSEHQKALEAYISYRNIPNITSKVIARWLKNYCIEDIKDALGLMLSAKNVGNPGGWIETVLQKGIVKQERVKKQNINFAKEMQPKNKYLKINSRYCKDIRFSDKEFYFHIDPEIFKSELRKCL